MTFAEAVQEKRQLRRLSTLLSCGGVAFFFAGLLFGGEFIGLGFMLAMISLAAGKRASEQAAELEQQIGTR